ncbi:amidase domain-containing protein [Staphylococcus epidermidis]|uniref:amidase domain-containing protein n=1 Tax=Staphylococcus epidermidis TaxID=1282 RepID=UPI002095F7EE|nr:amidase domain-containing protein [Staphylococcus epidermidis]MCO6338073.1 amidase domain-containing protein [Staphylococcus epidermidis]
MKKNKFLVYLLSTALITPTFATQTAFAEDSSNKNTNSDKMEQHQSQKETSKQSEKDEFNNDDSKHDSDDKKSTSDSKDKDSNKPLSADSTHRNYKMKDDNLVDQLYDNFKSQSVDFSKYWEPNNYEDSFSLTSLIQNLFDFDSDITDYEQPQKTNHSSNDEKDQVDQVDQADQAKQPSQHQEQSQSTAKQDQESSNDEKEKTTNHQADSDVSDLLGEMDKEDQEGEDVDTNKNQSSSEQQQTQANDDSSEHNKKYSSITDSALDSILDEYSQDAKKTEKDYNKSKNTSHTKTSQNDHADKNPQLPTDDELKHQSKPAQSFEDDIKRSNTRSTSLFQQLPELDNGDLSSDSFNVVDSQDTRDFIQSIAKDAHQIGKDQDIYASVMIAQAILESDSGKSSLAQSPNHNLFGIKGDYKGQSVTFNTLEADSSNHMFSIQAGFRKYPSTKQSLEDYADLIKHGIDGNPSIYKPTWKSEALSYKDATSHLSRSYATDPNYSKKLNSIIKHYHLTSLDKEKMPNMKKYNKSIGTDVSGNDFKPFTETSGTSPYPHGQCTWYVYHRMNQFDSSISGDLGDAHNWNNRAESEGYTVTHTPKNHTAVVFEAGQLGADTQYGHVAFVEKVNDDGSIVISESNVKGLGVISFRTIDAEDAQDLDYIKGK